jgi:hypothetical protein
MRSTPCSQSGTWDSDVPGASWFVLPRSIIGESCEDAIVRVMTCVRACTEIMCTQQMKRYADTDNIYMFTHAHA